MWIVIERDERTKGSENVFGSFSSRQAADQWKAKQDRLMADLGYTYHVRRVLDPDWEVAKETVDSVNEEPRLDYGPGSDDKESDSALWRAYKRLDNMYEEDTYDLY